MRSEGNDVASKLESSLWAGILFESESLVYFLFLGDSFEEEDIAVVWCWEERDISSSRSSSSSSSSTESETSEFVMERAK